MNKPTVAQHARPFPTTMNSTAVAEEVCRFWNEGLREPMAKKVALTGLQPGESTALPKSIQTM